MIELIRRSRPLLGTFVEISVEDEGYSDEIVTQAFAVIESVHHLMSFHEPDSELSLLNKSKNKTFELSQHTAVVLRLARYLSYKSHGLFNCMVGDRLIDAGVLPNHKQTLRSESTTLSDLHLKARKATCLKSVNISLDGIAKGYAVDSAVKSLRDQGVRAGLVNAGGDLRVFGDLSVPVQLRTSPAKAAGVLELNDIAMATTWVSAEANSDYPSLVVSTLKDRFPQQGTWSVLAPSAWLADGLTKVACLAGAKERASLVRSLGGKIVVAGELT